VRGGLARVAGRLIAARLSPDEETALVSLFDRMQEALSTRDSAAYGEANAAFHVHMMAACKNPRLIELNEAVESELNLYLRKGVYSIAQMHHSHDEHRKLLDAVRNGRVHEAAEAFEAHILSGKQRMLDTVTRTPGNP
jgi:DNA-binding GntR family transcriptional regulator